MDDQPPPNPALLPAGLRDLLPPDAETEAAGVEAIMAVFAAHAYRRVKPPLLEFEDSFSRGSGAAVADQNFRIMDPDSHRMMVLRADMTPQIARIATTRLAGAPRPLRLSYAGQCVRVRGAGPGTDRQVPQAGIELIGADGPDADAEVMLVAIEALAAVGVPRLSLDLTLPTLVPSLFDAAGMPAETRRTLLRALDRKDAAAVAADAGPLAGLLSNLLLAAGPAGPALAALRDASLPEPGRVLAARLAEVVERLARAAPRLRVTIDPVEFRGFRYHTGLALSLFAPGRHEELGRGGRYFSEDGEPATGITLYGDAVLRAAGAKPTRNTIFLPYGTDRETGRRLRAAGYATLAALGPTADPMSEACRLRCSHLLAGGAVQPVT
ncbi:MAG TPA: ATP phosphoribosyltransferase regulatory subunit [Acetobacteraceae bacterium]|nr:ATP phosphoribosyltransferase regulatory subunit [Acetobacteraceae bacterium]